MDALTYAFLYMRNMLLVRDEEGQDLAEYALLIALIALVVIVAVTALGGKIKDHLRQHRRASSKGLVLVVDAGSV